MSFGATTFEAATITWPSSGRPPIWWMTFGCLLLSRVPLPAARIAIAKCCSFADGIARYCTLRFILLQPSHSQQVVGHAFRVVSCYRTRIKIVAQDRLYAHFRQRFQVVHDWRRIGFGIFLAHLRWHRSLGQQGVIELPTPMF